MPILSFTANRSLCLQPRYCSVVWIETWPSRNWIWSSSPPAKWHRRAHVRRRSWGDSLSVRCTVGLIARECLTERAVVGEAGADAVALFDHGCARTVTGQRPCHLVATHMASAVAARYPRARRGASRESASYPARRCLTAVFRARVEGDGRLRRDAMDGVDHRFKQY